MPASQLVQFALRSGIDERTDVKNAPPGTVTSLVNMRQLKTGQYARRYGHTTLSKNILGGGTIGACKRLATRKNELLISDGTNLYSYSESLTDWVTRGRVPNCVSRFNVVKQFDTDWSDPQYAYANGLELFSCTLQPNSSILAFVRDVVTGTVVSQPLLVAGIAASVFQSACCITGKYAVICWTDSGGVVRCAIMDLTNISNGWSSIITLASDAIGSGSPLVIRELAGNQFVLVYAGSVAGPNQRPEAINVTVTSATTVTVNATGYVGVAGSSVVAFSMDYDAVGNLLYLAWVVPSSSLKVASFNATSLVVAHTGATALSAGQSTGIVVMGSNDIRLLLIGGAQSPNLYYTLGSTLASFTGAGTFYWGHLKSNLWSIGSSVYAIVRYAKTNYVCELVTQSTSTNGCLRPTCTMTPRTAYALAQEGSGETAATMALPRVFASGNNHYRAVSTQISDASTASRNGLVVHDMVFGDDWINNGAKFPAQHLQPVEFGDLLHLSGGMPCSYDGNRLVEQSFLFGPQNGDIPNLTPANAGGSLGAGVYQYQFTYEWIDDAGNVCRSEPSAPVSVTTVGVGLVNKVTILVPCNFLTTKSTYPITGVDSPSTQVAVIVYRTTVNGDGSLFYRQTAHTVPASNLSFTGAQFVTIVDTLSDASLTATATASLLYTNGGTQAWQAPPSLTSLIKHRQRLAGIGDDGRTVWFSSEFVDRESPKWNDNLVIEFDEPLTAIASLDDVFLAFSVNNIWYVTGDGPNDLGQGNDWSNPVRIPSDAGCVDPRSVISTSSGVMFRSYSGYYFIDRGRNVSFIGSMVRDTTTANALDVCALYQAHGETSCFMSMVPSAGSSTGIRLHWDTFRTMWAKDLLTDGSTVGSAVAGLASWKGSVVWATPGGQVYQQVTSAWTDGGAWYDSSMITAFIEAGGPAGFQRVRAIQVDGDWCSNHDVRLSLGFDFDDNFVQVYRWTAGTIDIKHEEYVRMRVGSQNGANPRCEGVRLKLEMLTPTAPTDYPIGTGQAATLSGIGLEIVPKTGQRRLRPGVQV